MVEETNTLKSHADEIEKYNEFDASKMKEKYNDLAANYDQTLVDVVGYVDPVKMADAISTHLNLPKDAKIIDLGCGTGLTGMELKKVGFTDITGTDASDGMLVEAEKKQAYNKLVELYCCRDQIPEDLKGKFDVACSTGLMAHDHVDGTIISEKI